MPVFDEIARAKINLTLRIHGRRADGYHELESIVVFADIGDRLRLVPHDQNDAGRQFVLRVRGPFAGEIVGTNLITTAVDLVEQAANRSLDCDIELDKTMPVASGIGGGSADAAAALRAIRAAYPGLLESSAWDGIARRLGADVPVCVASRPSLMSGIGETLAPMLLPRLDIVLANARLDVPADKTRQVFRALAAPPLEASVVPSVPHALDREMLLALMRDIGNDLAAPATKVVPGIRDLQDAVAAQPGCDIALLSGAGPTIVGVFSSAGAAADAARRLLDAHPSWWVKAGACCAID